MTTLQNPGGTVSEEILSEARAALTLASEAERTSTVQAFTVQVLAEQDMFLFFTDNVQVHGPKVVGVKLWSTTSCRSAASSIRTDGTGGWGTSPRPA